MGDINGDGSGIVPKTGATVKFKSDVPVWEWLETFTACCRAATDLHNLVRHVSLSFTAEFGRLEADFAWKNKSFARVKTRLGEYRDRYVDVSWVLRGSYVPFAIGESDLLSQLKSVLYQDAAATVARLEPEVEDAQKLVDVLSD